MALIQPPLRGQARATEAQRCGYAGIVIHIAPQKSPPVPESFWLLIKSEVITTSGIVIHNVVAALKRL
jgi:hypothetical protein